MADATGVCYTQSGNVKRYEHYQNAYWGFYRYSDNRGAPNKGLFAYMYRYYGGDVHYEDHPLNDIIQKESTMFTYEIDSTGQCNYNINPGRKYDTSTLSGHRNTLLGTFYDFIERVNSNSNDYTFWNSALNGNTIPNDFNTTYMHKTLEGLIEGEDYICKKYSYGTEEYNEFLSYIIAGNLQPQVQDNYAFILKLCNGDSVNNDGYNSFIKNFSDEQGMPDLIVWQNYGYYPSAKGLDKEYVEKLPNSNIYVFSVLNIYHTINYVTVTIEIDGWGNTIEGNELNLSSTNYMILETSIGNIIIDSPFKTYKLQERITGNNYFTMNLNTRFMSDYVSLTGGQEILDVTVTFENCTMEKEPVNVTWDIDDTTISNFNMTDEMDWLWSMFSIDKDDPSGINGNGPLTIAQYENGPLKNYIISSLGNTNIGGVCYHQVSPGINPKIEAHFMLGVKQDGDKFNICNTGDIRNNINSWSLKCTRNDNHGITFNVVGFGFN